MLNRWAELFPLKLLLGLGDLPSVPGIDSLLRSPFDGQLEVFREGLPSPIDQHLQHMHLKYVCLLKL